MKFYNDLSLRKLWISEGKKNSQNLRSKEKFEDAKEVIRIRKI